MTARAQGATARRTTTSSVPGLARTLRLSASALVLMSATYYVVVAFDNLTNPASNWAFVRGVMGLDGVLANSGFEWRAIHATWLQVAAYVVLIAFELGTGLLLLYGGFRGLRSSRDATSWAAAQRWTFIGVVTGLLVFFLGFITIGGNWFVMYLNSRWNGLEPAFENSVMTMFAAVFVLGVLVSDRLGVGDDA